MKEYKFPLILISIFIVSIFIVPIFIAANPFIGKFINQVYAKDELSPLSDVNLKFIYSEIEYTWGNDPFLKNPGHLPGPENKEKLPEISAILSDESGYVVIIDEEILHIGDKIKGKTIKEIGENYVVLGNDNSLIEVQLKPRADQITHTKEDNDSNKGKINIEEYKEHNENENEKILWNR